MTKRAGKEFSNFRNKFNKVSRQAYIKKLPSMLELDTMMHIANEWASVGNPSLKEKEDRLSPYRQIMNIMVQNPNLLEGFVTFIEGKAVGFSVWEKTKTDTANGLAALCLPEEVSSDQNYENDNGNKVRPIPGIPEFQTIMACELLQAQGVAYYNLGGSETLELHEFKGKGRPVKNVTIASYDVSYKTANQMGVRIAGVAGYMAPKNPDIVASLLDHKI